MAVKHGQSYEELLELIRSSGREFNMEMIDKAYQLANGAHQGQMRLSGEPYIIHPLAVSCILVELGMDSESVVGGLLHDVVEDTDYTLEDIRKLFNQEVANLIDGVTKLGKIPIFPGRAAGGEYPENAHRHVGRYPGYYHQAGGPAAQYAYLAVQAASKAAGYRIGKHGGVCPHRSPSRYPGCEGRAGRFVSSVSGPGGLPEIEDTLEMQSKDRIAFIDRTKEEIRQRVSEMIPNVYLEGRVKSINGIFRKMFIQGKTMEKFSTCTRFG